MEKILKIQLTAKFCHFSKQDLLVALYNAAKEQTSTIKHAVISKSV